MAGNRPMRSDRRFMDMRTRINIVGDVKVGSTATCAETLGVDCDKLVEGPRQWSMVTATQYE